MKTIEEKLKSAQATIKQQKKDMRAKDHWINKYEREIKNYDAETQISNAKLRSAEMFISYIQSLVSPDSDVRIPLKDLYEFAGTHEVEWQPEDGAIVIKTHKKEVK
jgi:hypothetical protein